jgi:hypothetical protein
MPDNTQRPSLLPPVPPAQLSVVDGYDVASMSVFGIGTAFVGEAV